MIRLNPVKKMVNKSKSNSIKPDCLKDNKNNNIIPNINDNCEDINKRKLISFFERLRLHLSDEYLYIAENKDDLENKLIKLKLEQSQNHKTLFPNIEQKGSRKYFSPLNIQEIPHESKDEVERQLEIKIESVQAEISQIESRMRDIKRFLSEIEEMSK